MTSVTPEVPEFPESFSAVLRRLHVALAELRRLRAASDGDPAGSEQALTSWISQVGLGARGLKDCGQSSLASVLEACAAACERLQAVPALQGHDALEAIERALAAVLDHAERPWVDPVAQAWELFPVYRAVQHLAGAQRVHPADLWPGWAAWRELPADPFTPPRAVDAAAREALEAALLALMRQPRAEDFQRMSELCASLGEGASPPQATVWKLASAVYEAQAEGRLSPDVYLKRLGPRLLALTRPQTPAGMAPDRSMAQPPGPVPGAGQLLEPVRTLAHELLFFCHRALLAGAGDDWPAGPRLARFVAAHAPAQARWADLPAEPGSPDLESPEVMERPDTSEASEASKVAPSEAVPHEPVAFEPAASATRRSLADAVPGLPSAADLDLSSWAMAANADVALVPDDEVKVIGPLRLEIPVFNAFLNDADEASRRLATLLAEWALEPAELVPEDAVEQAVALARGSARVGHVALADLADALARALRVISVPPSPFAAELPPPGGQGPGSAPTLTPHETADSLIMAANEIRRVLHQFAAGFLTEPAPRALERLEEISHVAPQPIGPSDLRYLRQALQVQAGVTQALDRLAACRPSALAASQDPEQADLVFEAAWAQAVDGVRASQELLESLLRRGGDPSIRGTVG